VRGVRRRSEPDDRRAVRNVVVRLDFLVIERRRLVLELGLSSGTVTGGGNTAAAVCVNAINQYRATKNLPPLGR